MGSAHPLPILSAGTVMTTARTALDVASATTAPASASASRATLAWTAALSKRSHKFLLNSSTLTSSVLEGFHVSRGTRQRGERVKERKRERERERRGRKMERETVRE